MRKGKKQGSLPIVEEVTLVYNHQVTGADVFDHVGSFVLVCPDPKAGRRNRYSVLRIDYQTGRTTVIGRELSLAHAKRIAKSRA